MSSKTEVQKTLCRKYGQELESVMDSVAILYEETGRELLGTLLINIIEEADELKDGSSAKFLKEKKSLTSLNVLRMLYHDDKSMLSKLGNIYWKIKDINSELAIKLGKEKSEWYVA